MISIHDPRIKKYITPYRCPEPVLQSSGQEGAFDRLAVDIPFVFMHRGKYYMVYTGFDGIGYQAALAVSDDLLHWRHKGIILKRRLDTDRWDRIGGTVNWLIRKNENIWEMPTLRKVDGKYWMVYHSYPDIGYESGPAEVGLAWTKDEELLDWHFPDSPCFSWRDGESWEKGGLYKACVFEFQNIWYLFYNAKDRDKTGNVWTEQTGMAYSRDLQHWTRYRNNPLLSGTVGSWDERFVSDPCILRDGDTWLNFYTGLSRAPEEDGLCHAQGGLALSTDLLHWEKVDEPILRHGSWGSKDSIHAHKPSVVYDKGILYHFYCGTCPAAEAKKTEKSGEFRAIYVAASKPVF